MRKGEIESRLLALVTLGLVAFGLVMVYSATSAAAALGGADPSSYLKRQAVYALLGVALLIGASRFDYRRLKAVAPGLVLSSLALCALVLVAGTRVNGARRWLSLGPAAFQPSELAKLALAIWAAAYLTRRRAPQTLRELLRPIGLLAGLFCGLILLEPYRRARVFSFLHPWHDAQGAGFQTVQALIGLGSGGVFGDGLGQGIQKVNYLPEAHTDMIFAVIGEELGLIGTAALVLGYALFAYAGLRIALVSRDPFGKRLASGIVALVCGQAVINLAAVLGLAPLTGIPLPFVSYGGSSLVLPHPSVGVLLNIAGDGRRASAAVRDRGRGDGRARPARARDRGRTAPPGR